LQPGEIVLYLAAIMPGRKIPLVNNEIYHVFNRGCNRQPTFTDRREHLRAEVAIDFYKTSGPPTSLSKFLKLDKNRQDQVIKILEGNDKLVEIICYCLMPNHFHFLLRQLKQDGISKFLSNFQNSYTRYFNIKQKRDGSLFLDQFKAVRVETEEQLLHVSRYIHLNPHTGFVVKTLEELKNYKWSSFPLYMNGNEWRFVTPQLIIGLFKSSKKYEQFVLDQADYQRKLHEIKHLLLEKP
jgi:putative transposase